tara:strand:+ start:473 stop:1513 length:1041 start_codon:yes stop_codon:yes gene_type:complete
MRRALAKSLGAVEERFIISVKTDNAGTSADNEFTLPVTGTGYNYDIEYDGQTLTGQTGSATLTFPSGPGTYDIKISGSFPRCLFNNGGDKDKLLDIKNFGIYALGSISQDGAFQGCSNLVISATDIGNFGSVTSFFRAWASCSSLTSFPLLDTSSGISFQQAWIGCSSLTSFPLLDLSNATRVDVAWEGCANLTSFPLINTSNVTNFERAWWNCNGLTSFPAIDTSSGTKFNGAWMRCRTLVSFPLLDFSNAVTISTNYYAAWRDCNSLENFPSNAFDTTPAANYTNAFNSTNLTTQSIDDILVSIDTSGTINGTFTQSGGQAPSATGIAAKDSLVAKGWTITYTA